MKRSRANWFNDPMMKRLLWEEHMLRTRAALDELYQMGLIAICPGGRYKPTNAARREYKWNLL